MVPIVYRTRYWLKWYPNFESYTVVNQKFVGIIIITERAEEIKKKTI